MRQMTFDDWTRDFGWSVEEIEAMIGAGHVAVRTGQVIRIWRHEDDARADTVRSVTSPLAAKLWVAEFNRRVRRGKRS